MLTKLCYAWSLLTALLKLAGVSFMSTLSWKMVLLPAVIAFGVNVVLLLISAIILWKLK
ncbi:hypothetical protein [Microbulbifer discodermiae]|uniref:hypothetical protein n=1 Tax=Microbulbifer sp. 2201CG32-9 TaxID=3232309 RepID=UPI00345C03B2